MRNKFDEQLELLNDSLITMGGYAEETIALASKALIAQDVELAKKAVESSYEINQQSKEIETLCLKLLLRQQPVAKDLRLISAALKIITDIKRIGDQGADIAGLTLRLALQPRIKNPGRISQMAKETIKMVKESIDAFVNNDLELANSVVAYDDVVDGLFNGIKDDLIELIRQDVNNGEQAVDLLMIAKYFERIGDHAVIIAEWAIYAMTGVHEEFN